MAPLNNATREYTRQAVLAASPAKLVCLLYDGAIRNMEQAKAAIARKAPAPAGAAISRAYGIVSELRVSLDHEAGNGRARPITSELERLYLFVLDSLIAANLERSEQKVDNALRVMKTLKEGWDGIVHAA